MQKKEKLEAVVFRFPRSAADGEPHISAKEKSVEFLCRVAGAEMKANFELAKMASRDGPDF
jgi:hypothetical protein